MLSLLIILVATISIVMGNLDSKQTGGQTTVLPDTEITLYYYITSVHFSKSFTKSFLRLKSDIKYLLRWPLTVCYKKNGKKLKSDARFLGTGSRSQCFSFDLFKPKE